MTNTSPFGGGRKVRFGPSPAERAIPADDRPTSPMGRGTPDAGTLTRRLDAASARTKLAAIPGAGRKKKLSLNERLANA